MRQRRSLTKRALLEDILQGRPRLNGADARRLRDERYAELIAETQRRWDCSREAAETRIFERIVMGRRGRRSSRPLPILDQDLDEDALHIVDHDSAALNQELPGAYRRARRVPGLEQEDLPDLAHRFAREALYKRALLRAAKAKPKLVERPT